MEAVTSIAVPNWPELWRTDLRHTKSIDQAEGGLLTYSLYNEVFGGNDQYVGGMAVESLPAASLAAAKY